MPPPIQHNTSVKRIAPNQPAHVVSTIPGALPLLLRPLSTCTPNFSAAEMKPSSSAPTHTSTNPSPFSSGRLSSSGRSTYIVRKPFDLAAFRSSRWAATYPTLALINNRATATATNHTITHSSGFNPIFSAAPRYTFGLGLYDLNISADRMCVNSIFACSHMSFSSVRLPLLSVAVQNNRLSSRIPRQVSGQGSRRCQTMLRCWIWCSSHSEPSCTSSAGVPSVRGKTRPRVVRILRRDSRWCSSMVTYGLWGPGCSPPHG